MAGARAAIRYAKALLSLASDQNTTEVVGNDMKLIANTLATSKDLSEALQSPVIPSSIKKSTLLEVFKNADKSTNNLIDTLVTNNRINILGDIAVKYGELLDKSKGVEVATVTTAVALTDDLKKRVLEKAKTLTGKDVEVENIIDEDILGGFILRIGDLQYNASVANQLNKLKREFTLN
ncbi:MULTISPECIES: ATP synthase F1 subunit delta [Algibacter]|jgi:F-type H+-transporting ATPase subunit delta|uniref:ATP synthase subunit delta n=1 Tax=Algibacter lectus TaxID=221126 RepID=A0A090VBQ1_9FLAO|nr:ATP synthase F1 subunit delta [Algibacter lectus]MWW24465.1 ATP synthase F1 subunit delta [Algibacter lectus]TDY62484.1 ATP synthase F1 subcomplex delta subunit [Algibacter lectus]GAL62245.1 ATP synthase delta chain [Algibacter lectus]